MRCCLAQSKERAASGDRPRLSTLVLRRYRSSQSAPAASATAQSLPTVMAKPRRRRPPPALPPGLEVSRPRERLGSSLLIVEDEPPMQAQLRLDLTDLGYEARVAGSAQDAQDLLSHERVAGVLLDLVLDEGE